MGIGPGELGAAPIALKAAGKSQTSTEQAGARNVPKFLVEDTMSELAVKGLVRQVEEDGIPCWVVAISPPVATPGKPVAKPKAKARGATRLT